MKWNKMARFILGSPQTHWQCSLFTFYPELSSHITVQRHSTYTSEWRQRCSHAHDIQPLVPSVCCYIQLTCSAQHKTSLLLPFNVLLTRKQHIVCYSWADSGALSPVTLQFILPWLRCTIDASLCVRRSNTIHKEKTRERERSPLHVLAKS